MVQTLYLSLAIFLALIFGMFLFLEIGRVLGKRREINELRRARQGITVMEGAVFTLMGLLISFTFYAANMRFDARRQLIIDEVNAVGTAYLRIDLLPSSAQEPMRNDFRHYLDARIAAYDKLSALNPARAEFEQANKLQTIIWNHALVAMHQDTDGNTVPSMLLLPALNNMFDVANARTLAGTFHMPALVLLLLIALTFTSAVLAGYDMATSRKRSTVHVAGFILIVGVTVYTIMDFEFPRLGLIVLRPYHQSLVDLRDNILHR